MLFLGLANLLFFPQYNQPLRMRITELEIPGVYLIEPQLYDDDRGYFCESYNQRAFQEAGLDVQFVQDNQAFSTYGVLRGLHYQVPPFAQAKLVRVVSGQVLDIIVDIREGSPTYGQSIQVILSESNHRQLFVPQGFAHGYVVQSPSALFLYKCDNWYSKEHEGGIRFNDPLLALDWQLLPEELLLSEKDEQQPLFGAHLKYEMA